MHFPETIDESAAHVLVQTARAIMSVHGTVALAPLEQETLTVLAEDVCGRALADLSADLSPAATLPDDLAPVMASQTPAFRDAAVTVFCLLPMVGGDIAADKVEVARTVADRLGRKLPILDDLRALGRNRKARYPRWRILQRILRDVFHTSMFLGTLTIARTYLGLFTGASKRRYRRLAELDQTTLGGQLYRFYRQNHAPLPGEFKSFPASLVGGHDVRHVLAGFDTSFDGEMGIAAFEAGASDIDMTDYLCTLMLQGHLGIVIDPTVPARVGRFEPRAFVRQVRRGQAVRADITSLDWDYWQYLDAPLEQVRAELGIAPGGNVEGTGTDLSWRGADAFIINATPPPANGSADAPADALAG